MSDQVHHLAMGTWVVVLAYVIAAVSLFVGIACARQASFPENRRWLWTALAAMVIGGDAYWLTNIVTMAGFAVDGSVVRFNQLGILASLVICVAAVFAGLVVNAPRGQAGASTGDVAMVRLLGSAVLMGIGLTLGYYVAMLSIRIQGRTWMDGALTAVAGVVAVLASIGVLWMSNAEVPKRILGVGSLLVGVTPVLMHVAMMAAMRVRTDATVPVPDGGQVFVILFPAFVGSMLILIVPIVALLMATDRTTAEMEAETEKWLRPRGTTGQ